MRSLFRLLGPAAAGSLLLLSWAPGCANQSEGDRCDNQRNGSQDCEPPLVCWAASDLATGDSDRCCPISGSPISDDRCLPATTHVNHDAGTDAVAESSGGDSEADSTSDSSDAVSEEASSQSCTHSSDCPGTLVCGPTGVCQLQCINAKDCGLGETCKNNICVIAPPDAGDAGGD